MRRGQLAEMQRMLDGGATSHAASSEALSTAPDDFNGPAPAKEEAEKDDAKAPTRRTRRAAQPEAEAEKSETAVDSSTRP
jgi:hypothetical protein